MSPWTSEVKCPPRKLVMNSPSDNHSSEPIELGSPSASLNGIQFGHLVSIHGEVHAKHRLLLVQWLSTLLPSLNLPINITDVELRACLSDGTVLCHILNRLRPGSVTLVREYSDHSLPSHSENVKRFLKALDGLGLPKFEISDLEKGSMKAVVDCLLTLRAKSLQNAFGDNVSTSKSNKASPHGNSSSNLGLSSASGRHQRKASSELKFERVLRSPAKSELSSASLINQVCHKFHEVFQNRHGSYADLPASKISEMMKLNSLDTAPTQSLLSIVNDILEESLERRNGGIPHRVACLLRKVFKEIERRMSSQAEHLRTQNNLFKVREEKYQSRIRVLEALSSGARQNSEVSGLVISDLQQFKTGKIIQEEKKENEEGIIRLIEEKKKNAEEVMRLMKEMEEKTMEISALKQELETTKKTYEVHGSQLEAEAMGAKGELKQKSQEYEQRLEEMRNKIKELKAFYASQYQKWNMKDNQLQNAMNLQLSSLQKLKLSWESIKQDVVKEQRIYAEECNKLGVNLKSIIDAAEDYRAVLAENRKLFNEIQELKGNIRVYCRVRPFLSRQKEKRSIVEHIGENDLVVANPSKHGKDALRSFKFNKVFGPATTQGEVYSDIQSFIRSVLDGYNACIFAYGQTGSGKTYTMTGPNGATSENVGVNYRALNDLFTISKSRSSAVVYEIGVQMIEIYNEQVRDLLSTDGSPRKLGILNHSQPKGLAVPDASMFTVKSPSDVLKLMDIGLKNRVISATAMNERSSRSHSVVSIHVRGTDLKSGSTLHGNLHLVDLAGSERVDRSEVTGDRLKEAQHINKSLSALGDVIFALSQKSSHVPYRNSKLTQLLQTSLGGQAKTLMFVQINSDINSYSETLSTLKFAERVSGVELGAAGSSKEGRDVRELMEQVASMKDTILKKDKEIERLQLLKDVKNTNHGASSEKHGTASLRNGSSSPRKDSVGGALKRSQKPSIGTNNKHLDADSQQPMDSHIHQNEPNHQSEIAGGNIGQNIAADADFDERLSDTCDNGISLSGSPENSIHTVGTKSSDHNMEKSKAMPKNVPAVQKSRRMSSTMATVKDSLKKLPGLKKGISNSQLKSSKRWLK